MTSLQKVGVVGLGLIGARWAATFAHAGIDVIAHDPDEHRWNQFQSILPNIMSDLNQMAPPKDHLGEIKFSAVIGDEFRDVDFIQENTPENLDLKRKIIPKIEMCIRDDVVIASSSSALLVSDMQEACANPERIVLGHPFNPSHLMPLVEIVGGDRTAGWAVERAREVYEQIGKKPVVMQREMTGHIALRLMAAMWREAFFLISSGAATARDIDRAFCYGPGPKWTLQGSFISNHLGAEGIEEFLKKYGGTYEAIWDTLGSAELDTNIKDKVISQTKDIVAGRSNQDLAEARDLGLIEILKLQSSRELL
ncbi:3-hydroxyacyl-CoA dehydrogenase [Rhodoligotrophos appendicifer]|uniref:3-hydroxyacyl-CoA dehydrogenase NAD-binding domain-containing protein n=1 Tax=Rhodoligotrophos appendicifer TaxID=987056 RepID=UPI0011848EEB|nr:3-hydroxyacyl-CoA dehydrogenase NAD-binding domain-containing protein [Rhodoligotrophos appendicifer]